MPEFAWFIVSIGFGFVLRDLLAGKAGWLIPLASKKR
jgi:hypothetical protein